MYRFSRGSWEEVNTPLIYQLIIKLNVATKIRDRGDIRTYKR